MKKLSTLLVASGMLLSEAIASDIIIGLESFNLTERVGDYTVVEETGDRFRFGVKHVNDRNISCDLSFFFGDLQYDGHRLDGSKAEAISRWSGFSGYLDYSRAVYSHRSLQLGAFSGIGIDFSRRAVAKGNYEVGGVVEDWTMIYSSLGSKLKALGITGEIGLDFPFYAESRAYRNYGEIRHSLEPKLGYHVDLGYTNETYSIGIRFECIDVGKSKSKLAPDGMYWFQPDTYFEILSLYAGFKF